MDLTHSLTNKVAFIPEFTITPNLLAQVEEIAALRERIGLASVDLAWIPALQKDTRSRNAHASTAIEGNPLTLEQVIEFIDSTLPLRRYPSFRRWERQIRTCIGTMGIIPAWL